MIPTCTACGNEPDYQITLRHAPAPFWYCEGCKAIFMQSLDKLTAERREQVLAEMSFSPIDGSKSVRETG